MSELLPSYYFDLSTYAHKALFEGCAFVWQALEKIDSYLANFELGEPKGEISHQAYLIHPELISIGKGTVVEPGAYIKGPCIIGENCTVRHGAYIRGGVITGDGCVIGHDTEIKNSILLNHSVAAHFAYIGDSILGNQVNLGAGTKCANLKLDHGSVVLRIQGKRMDTGLKKLGAILGDGANLGCNCVTNPGTFMGKQSCSYPCTSFGGFVPAGHIVQPSQRSSVKPLKSIYTQTN